MKKVIVFLFGIILVCLGGCSDKKENQTFMGMEPDEYFICSYESPSENSARGKEDGAALINSKGELVEEFSGGFIRSILTEDGFMMQQGNGVISKGTTLLLSFPVDTWNYRTGAYLVGENCWLYESKESVPCVENYDDTGRLKNFQFGNEFYDRFFKKMPNEQTAVTYWGTEKLHNETDENGSNKIVNQDGKVVLTSETFYQKNNFLLSEPQSEPGNIELYDVYNEDCWKIGYQAEGMDFPKMCLCRSDGTVIEVQGLDYLNMDMGIDRYSYERGASSLESNRYLRMTDYTSEKEYCIKIEGTTAKLLELPEAEKTTYEGNDLFLLQNNNVYKIYDGEKEEVSCSVDMGKEASENIPIEILGKKAYYEKHIRDIEGRETIQYKFVFQDKVKNVNGSDVESILKLENGCTIINEKGNKLSLIVNRDGSYNEKTGKIVEWANDDYYLAYEKNTFSIYNMKDEPIKKIKLGL